MTATRHLLGIAAAMLWLGVAPVLGAEKPRRVVSMNLCTDQLVLLLADPGQVVSVSYLAARAEDSLMSERAAGLVLNHGQAEEILPMRPDLAVAGIHTTRFTVEILKREGIPVLDLPPAENFQDVRANIRNLAAVLGTRSRGETMIAAMDRRIAALGERASGRDNPRALIYRAGGHTLGPDTFAGALLDLAGYRNAAAEYGVRGWGAVPVDAVLQLRPDVLVVGVYRHDAPSLARDVTEHPALRRRMPRIVEVPTRRWACGTPAALDVIEDLIAVRDRQMAEMPR